MIEKKINRDRGTSNAQQASTEIASHARHNHDIRNVRFPDRLVVVGALGRAFDCNGIWDTRWPCCLRRLLRHGRDYGPSGTMSGAVF